MLRRLEHLTMMRELGLLSLEKRKLWGGLIVVIKYLKEPYLKKNNSCLQSDSNRMRGNGFKIKEG